MMKSLLAAGALLLLAACAAPTTAAEAIPPAQTAASDDAGACAARNGTIRPICRMQRMTCVIAYRDAGRACANDADCEGKCLLKGEAPADPNARVAGQCQASSDPCGCRTEVDGAKVKLSICVD